jgi:hypothetical protein
VAPPNRYPTNTWRNNFGIQKGIGCPAEPRVIERLLDDPVVRLACPHMGVEPEGRHVCRLRDTAYRGEEHSIWLRIAPRGYQVVNLDHPAVYGPYLTPSGAAIPIFPLIAALYSMAPSDIYPPRDWVGIPDFASDFSFDLAHVENLFDCDPDSMPNSTLLAAAAGRALPIATPPGTGAAEEPVPPSELPELPPAGEINTGVGAELAVGEDLRRHGWRVLYRGNQRGFGYDLEASRNEETLRVEVKSSVSFTTPELQQSEWEAAQRYRDEYILAVVDFYGSDQQRIWYVRDPAGTAVPVERPTVVFRFVRADVQPLGTDAEFL